MGSSFKSYFRINCNAGYYSDIAIAQYDQLKKLCAEWETKANDMGIIEKLGVAEEHMMVCCVFAEMALESFFNDYIAYYLGDKQFYDEFDKLTSIGKLQMIVEFIMKKDFDKSKGYYSALKSLKKTRNELVHNKSRGISAVGYKDVEECEAALQQMSFDAKYYFEKYLEEMKKILAEAHNAVKALVEIAKMFEPFDREVPVKKHLLGHSAWTDPVRYKEFCREFKIEDNRILG